MHSSSTCSIAAAALQHAGQLQNSYSRTVTQQLQRCCAAVLFCAVLVLVLPRCSCCTVVQFCGAAVLQLIAARCAPCCTCVLLMYCCAGVVQLHMHAHTTWQAGQASALCRIGTAPAAGHAYYGILWPYAWPCAHRYRDRMYNVNLLVKL